MGYSILGVFADFLFVCSLHAIILRKSIASNYSMKLVIRVKY